MFLYRIHRCRRQYWPCRSWSVLVTRAINLVHTLGNRQDRLLHVGHWDDVMHLKLPVNSFLIVGERERGNVCANSEFTSFIGTCRYRVLKIWRLRNASLALSLSIDGTNFERSFFSLAIACSSSLWFDFSVTIFFLHASMLRNISYFWFLNRIKKFPLSVFPLSTSLSLQFYEGRLP